MQAQGLMYDEGHYSCHPWPVRPTLDPLEAGLSGDLWLSREKEQEDHVKHPLAICQPCVHTHLTLGPDKPQAITRKVVILAKHFTGLEDSSSSPGTVLTLNLEQVTVVLWASGTN